MMESNLKRLRKQSGLSQEQVAEKLNVSRQAVAKWESGDSLPDIYNCRALADLYDITIDSLFDAVTDKKKKDFHPKGKHIFGAVKVGKDGMIKLPKKAMKVFDLKEGETLLVLGDESQGGIALCKTNFFVEVLRSMKASGCKDITLEDVLPSETESDSE
ncbi:MAG: helix-turn-helix domain-containing protein [Oscillospiraceae bacterium]|nr:helix-turn-helix domain-containing protein [Oscillospiraceae bacterium]